MFQDRCYERDNDINNNFYAENMENNIDYNINQGGMMMPNMMSGGYSNPIVEQMQERVVNRTIMHEVPQE